jgi:hypothetical protein
MNILAAIYYSQGRDDEAIQLMERVIHLMKKIIEPGHPFTKNSIELLAEWTMNRSNHEMPDEISGAGGVSKELDQDTEAT